MYAVNVASIQASSIRILKLATINSFGLGKDGGSCVLVTRRRVLQGYRGTENGDVGQTKQVDVPGPYDEYEEIHLDVH